MSKAQIVHGWLWKITIELLLVNPNLSPSGEGGTEETISIFIVNNAKLTSGIGHLIQEYLDEHSNSRYYNDSFSIETIESIGPCTINAAPFVLNERTKTQKT